MPGKHRKHTPYMSEAQATAGNIALAAREGKIPKSKLKGASKEMAKGKDLPYKVTKRKMEHKGHNRDHRKGKY